MERAGPPRIDGMLGAARRGPQIPVPPVAANDKDPMQELGAHAVSQLCWLGACTQIQHTRLGHEELDLFEHHRKNLLAIQKRAYLGDTLAAPEQKKIDIAFDGACKFIENRWKMIAETGAREACETLQGARMGCRYNALRFPEQHSFKILGQAIELLRPHINKVYQARHSMLQEYALQVPSDDKIEQSNQLFSVDAILAEAFMAVRTIALRLEDLSHMGAGLLPREMWECAWQSVVVRLDRHLHRLLERSTQRFKLSFRPPHVGPGHRRIPSRRVAAVRQCLNQTMQTIEKILQRFPQLKSRRRNFLAPGLPGLALWHVSAKETRLDTAVGLANLERFSGEMLQLRNLLLMEIDDQKFYINREQGETADGNYAYDRRCRPNTPGEHPAERPLAESEEFLASAPQEAPPGRVQHCNVEPSPMRPPPVPPSLEEGLMALFNRPALATVRQAGSSLAE